VGRWKLEGEANKRKRRKMAGGEEENRLDRADKSREGETEGGANS
jgi:hypothetical protein